MARVDCMLYSIDVPTSNNASTRRVPNFHTSIPTLIKIKNRGEVDPNYEIGKTINFGQPSEIQSLIKAGWHDIEDWGRWSNEECELQIRLPAADTKSRELELRILFSVYNPGGFSPRFEAAANDIKLYANAIPDGDRRRRLLVCRMPVRGCKVILRFRFPDAAIPMKFGQNDKRVLGGGFYSFSLNEPGAPLESNQQDAVLIGEIWEKPYAKAVLPRVIQTESARDSLTIAAAPAESIRRRNREIENRGQRVKQVARQHRATKRTPLTDFVKRWLGKLQRQLQANDEHRNS